MQSAPRGFQRFGKPSSLGQGGGEGAKNDRVFSAGQFIGLPGQFHRFVTVAQRGLRSSGQEPGQIVLGFHIGWFNLQRQLELGRSLRPTLPFW